jgi:WD40 repeat protein
VRRSARPGLEATLLLAVAALAACRTDAAAPAVASHPATTPRPARLDIALEADAAWVEFRSPTSLLVGLEDTGMARGIAEYAPASGERIRLVAPAGGGRADWSPRSGRLAYAVDSTVEVIALADGSSVRRFGDLWASSVALSPDGRLLAVSHAQPETPPAIQLFDVATGKQLASVAPRSEEPLPYDSGFRLLIAFTADGRRLAALLVNDTPQEAELSIWSVPGGAREAAWPITGGIDEPGMAPSLGDALAVAPDGSAVAAGDLDAAVHRFPILGGEQRLFPRRGRAITAVAFSPDGSMMAAAGEDGPLALWSHPDGREIAKAAAPEKCGSLAFSPDGRLIAAGCARAVAIWQVDMLHAAARPGPSRR